MTTDEKNRIRVKVRLFGLVQWAIVLAVGTIGWIVGKEVSSFAGILAASTTGMTTLIGLDYFSKPSKGTEDSESTKDN